MSLSLSEFRNYGSLRLETDERPVVLTGPNGAGKTNLLEAVSLLTPGKGLRSAKLSEILRRPGERGERAVSAPAQSVPEAGTTWAVAGRIATTDGVVEVGTGLAMDGGTKGRERRVVRVDGTPVRSQMDLASILSAVWLTPRMDLIFSDSTAARRRFLDRLVFSLDPPHARRVGKYEHTLRERTRVLRGGAVRGPKADGHWLNVLEDSMATTGVAIAAARREVAGRLNRVDATSQRARAFPSAEMTSTGVVEEWLDAGPALDAEEKLRAALRASRSRDAETGGAAVGPHRSDVKITHGRSGLAAEHCSTGEQKALLISAILSLARLQAAERGSVPILLLDEIAARLDEERRCALFGNIAAIGAQAWLTGTDESVFAPLGATAQYFHVEDATVTPW
ncbi:MAG TPA: DNA replication/repair protein RecF [Rhodospirillales bacterium]|nr:DNA replication/repair protein RecF [Rhodospirillales bacterium]